MINICLYLLILSVPQYFSSDIDEESVMEAELNCRERNRLVTDAKDDAYNTIEGSLGETVKMQCHFW